MDNHTLSEPIVTEKRRYSSVLYIVPLFVILTASLLVAYSMYQKNHRILVSAPVPTTAESEFTATDLTEAVPIGALPGSILYRTFQKSENTTVPYLGMSTVSTGETKSYSEKGFFASFLLTATSTLVIQNSPSDSKKFTFGFLSQNSDIVTPEHEVMAFNLADVVVADNKTMYAYSFQMNEATTTGADSIDNWSVEVRTSLAGDALTIANAVHPQWVDSNTAVIFMKTDGIYKIDLTTNIITKISGLDERVFTVFDGLAVSGDAAKMILTSAQKNQIEVVSLNTEDSTHITARTIGHIVSPAVNYSNPLFSPDNQYYSVVSTRLTELAVVDELLDFQTDARIETRYVTNADVLQSVKIDDETESGVTLLGWLAI